MTPTTQKVSAALRQIYGALPAAAAIGVAAALSFSASARADMALPTIETMASEANEFVTGIRDEMGGNGGLAAGAAPADAREMGVEWQRINDMSPGEVASLSRIVMHTNSELRAVHADLRENLQAAGERFQEADYLANMAVVVGAMAGDADPFNMTQGQGIRLQEAFITRITDEKPDLADIVSGGIYHAQDVAEYTAAGHQVRFDKIEGVIITDGIEAPDPALEVWYSVNDLDRGGLRELSRQLGALEAGIADHRDSLASSLSAAGLPANDAERMADLAIVTGAMVGGGAAMGLDRDRAIETRATFLKAAGRAYGNGEVAQIIIEGCEVSRRMASQSTELDISPM